MPRSSVQRARWAAQDDDDDPDLDDLDDDDIALLDAEPDIEAVPPFEWVGVVSTAGAKDDVRVVDGTGRSVTLADVYRVGGLAVFAGKK